MKNDENLVLSLGIIVGLAPKSSAARRIGKAISVRCVGCALLLPGLESSFFTITFWLDPNHLSSAFISSSSVTPKSGSLFMTCCKNCCFSAKADLPGQMFSSSIHLQTLIPFLRPKPPFSNRKSIIACSSILLYGALNFLLNSTPLFGARTVTSLSFFLGTRLPSLSASSPPRSP